MNVGVKKQKAFMTFSGIEPSVIHFMCSPMYCLQNNQEKKNKHSAQSFLLSVEGDVGSYYYCESYKHKIDRRHAKKRNNRNFTILTQCLIDMNWPKFDFFWTLLKLI